MISYNNPDILTCLANLSSDEVFTPPKIVNDMLDLLPQNLFTSPDTKFLDPASKSGVFLREIARRLINGLSKTFPDIQERINHIMQNQIFSIAITELTSFISRRSLYCSMNPDSKFSVCKFQDSQGNVRFKSLQHTFNDKGKCIYCGADQSKYKRDNDLETHAYEFIHTLRPEAIFNMKFDVIISNPPYQMTTAGSVQSQATPIYNEFVENAKKLNPRYISMIIPSRWMNGGFGLADFRDEMLKDRHIRILHDFIKAEDCFPGVSISGGVCYFLWDRDNEGTCKIFSHRENQIISEERYLLEEGVNTFIRFKEGLSILKKVQSLQEKSFSDIVSPRDPFGLNYYENGRERMFKIFDKVNAPDKIKIYHFNWQEDSPDYAERKYITTNIDAVTKYKVYISKANGAASHTTPYAVLSKPFIGEPDTICNMTYLLIGPFDNRETAENVISYITTKFFRFLVLLLKNTPGAYRQVYQFVPIQDFTRKWTDSDLYAKYNLDSQEIAFIESMIKPMQV